MFRFTIRDLLWLTALSAALVAWGIDHVKTRIDWQRVQAKEREFQAAKEVAFWAQMRAEIAQEQKALVLRAAARRGITPLDIEPETTIPGAFPDEK